MTDATVTTQVTASMEIDLAKTWAHHVHVNPTAATSVVSAPASVVATTHLSLIQEIKNAIAKLEQELASLLGFISHPASPPPAPAPSVVVPVSVSPTPPDIKVVTSV